VDLDVGGDVGLDSDESVVGGDYCSMANDGRTSAAIFLKPVATLAFLKMSLWR